MTAVGPPELRNRAMSAAYSLIAQMGVFVHQGHGQIPRLGRVVPELHKPEIREIFLGNYRMAYRIMGNAVVILTV